MMKKTSGSIVVSGEGALEYLDVHLVLTEESRAAFQKDPEAFMAAFLRDSGIAVNGVVLGTEWCERMASDSLQAGGSARGKCVHVTKGEFESFSFCTD